MWKRPAATGGRGRLYWFYRRSGQRIPITSPEGRRLQLGDAGFLEAYECIHDMGPGCCPRPCDCRSDAEPARSGQPPLVEQWTGELNAKFDLEAVAVTASSAPRLERGLPPSQTLFDAHPYTVVSLDYIKADRRRDTFARACPKLVVVDEAHACVGTHQNRQQRFELLKRLADQLTACSA
jgi:hypothetical protein